jgi:hypothetical protein
MTTNPNNPDMDYLKKFDEYTYGYTLIVVQVCGGVVNVFTSDHKTAEQAVARHEDWTKHFNELNIKYPESDSIHKIEIKRMLNWSLDKSYSLQDITLDELKSYIK